MFSMTAKRFWMLMTLGGVLVFVGGLVVTILLVLETGERVPDSQCSSMHPSVMAVCYTSDDPAVLLGVGPMLAGVGIVVVGAIKWARAASFERATTDSEVSAGPPPGIEEPENPLEHYEALRTDAKRRDPQ